jgi:hypothetical protein
MTDNEQNINWLISTHGSFLQQFGLNQVKIVADYDSWKISNSDPSIPNYLCELIRQASLYNIKNAKTEEEFYKSKLQLDIKMLEFSTNGKNEEKNYILGQIHFDKLILSRLTLPYKFHVQINANNCCPYCAKKDKKTFTLEKVIENKYLPFTKCIKEEGCSCSYSIVPLHDEEGKLIPKETE